MFETSRRLPFKLKESTICFTQKNKKQRKKKKKKLPILFKFWFANLICWNWIIASPITGPNEGFGILLKAISACQK